MKQSEILKAYKEMRPFITDGCLFLTSKNKFVSKFIRWADGAEVSHVGMLITKYYGGEKRVMVIDSNAGGVKLDFFSSRLKDFDNLIIMKPTSNQSVIDKSVLDSYDRAAVGIKYDYFGGLKEMWNRKGRWFKFKIKPSANYDICSDYTRQHSIDCDIVNAEFCKLQMAYPQDYLRYHNKDKVEIIRAIDYYAF
ncbi:MAG: hypothetical protein ACUZ8H_16125 [Candidatus Anammoxibacter sp.]